MSSSPHREKDAKAEGCNPPETLKETLAPFRALMGKLLKVPISEMKEQQSLYEASRSDRIIDTDMSMLDKPKFRKKKRVALPATLSEKSGGQHREHAPQNRKA